MMREALYVFENGHSCMLFSRMCERVCVACNLWLMSDRTLPNCIMTLNTLVRLDKSASKALHLSTYHVQAALGRLLSRLTSKLVKQGWK